MTGGAAVGVDDDLAARQTAVAHRATDHELAGGVDDDYVGEVARLVHTLGQDGLHDVLKHVWLDERLYVDPVGMLRGQHHLGDLHRHAVLVAHGDLGLAVGPQVGQDLGLADLTQAARKLVCQVNGHGHEFGSLGAGVAEHHALVAGALRVENVVVVDVRARLQ